MIPYSKQFIDNSDIKNVNKVLKGHFITQGPTIENFEKKIAKYVGSKYAVAVSSCSAGLHLAAIASDLSKGKKILTSPNSFCSTANAAKHCDADVDFVDIDYDTGNLSLDEIKKKISKKKINVIIPVHFGGLPVDMRSLKKIVLKKK